ncbi:ankyrin repeat domain-containing protein 35 isoform X2 [Ambystoma mexicanum]|uniref:ankyrin repeat domain-containing protein 35 isoform X2 n=1 Tax=Ambystoma mexicanum TaxID=8296 RepID=UPI0037E82BE7
MKRIFSCSSSQVAIEKWNKHDQKLFEAVEKRDLAKISTLLAKKPVRPSKPNPKGQSAFHLAAAKGLTECLTALLSHGVELNAKNDQGCTALHLSAGGCHPECVKLLLQNGANEDSIDFHSRTALHCAASSGCVSSVLLLCDQDEISLDAIDDDGWTPLMIAAQRNHPTICSLLLERGALVNIIDKEKKTALILASEKGNIQAAETLLAHGADASATDSLGHDALYYTSLSRDEPLRKLIQGALDKREQGNEIDQALTRSQDSIDVHTESHAHNALQNNTRYNHLAFQQDDWRRRYEEEQKKVSQLQEELLKKSHEHEVFAEGCRTEKDRIKARVHEITGLLQRKDSDKTGRRSQETRPLSQGFDQPYFLDLLAGQVQVLKEKHEEMEKEKLKLLGETANMVSKEKLAEDLQQQEKRHRGEMMRLQDQVTLVMEEKASALRRVSEIEGHLDNMRSVLSQFENRKRVQSTMMEDLNEHVFEMTSENDRLRELVRTLQEQVKEEKTGSQERALANKCKNAQNVLDSTVRELRQLLLQTRMECANIQKEKQAILAPRTILRKELGDPVQTMQHSELEPVQALERCVISWKKAMITLEHVLTNLEKSNCGMLDSYTHIQKPIAPSQNESYQGDYEANVFVNGSVSAVQESYRLLKDGSRINLGQGKPSKNTFLKGDQNLLHKDVLYSQGEKHQQDTERAEVCEALGITKSQQDLFPTTEHVELQEALSRILELEKEVSVLTLENAGLLKELDYSGEEKGKLQGELKALRQSLQTGFVPVQDVQCKVGELEQNFLLLTDELSTEQERTRKLTRQLDTQTSEMHQLRDSFPRDIVQEEKSKDGKTFSSDILEELFWNVGTLVRKHNEIKQQKVKLEQENKDLKFDQTKSISMTAHNEKLASLLHKIDQQASEMEELEKKLSSALKSVDDLAVLTRKIDDQATEIQELEQRLSIAIGVIEDLNSVTRKIDAQASVIGELEQKLFSATRAIKDLTEMTHKIDDQATEIQELEQRLSIAIGVIEDLNSVTRKIDAQASVIGELEQKLFSATRAIKDLTEMTHKIDDQAIEIKELQNELLIATKSVEGFSLMSEKIESQTSAIKELQLTLSIAKKTAKDLASRVQKCDDQAIEIQDLKLKLYSASKTVEDFTSLTHKIETQTTEIQELENKLSNAMKAIEELTTRTLKLDQQAVEIRDLEHKLSIANKAVEDFSSITHKIECQTIEMQELQQRLSNAFETAEDLTSMASQLDSQAAEIGELQQKLSAATKDAKNFQKELLAQKTNSMTKDEHMQILSAVEQRLIETRSEMELLKEMLAGKSEEVQELQQQLNQASVEAEEMKSREEISIQDHHKTKSSLEFHIQALKEELKVMSEKFNQACAQASSLDIKYTAQISTKEDQSSKIIRLEAEAAEHLAISETSQDTIKRLLEKVSEFSCLCEDKEKRISELMSDLQRVSKQVVDLQGKHDQLQLQLKDSQNQHQQTVSIYRTHLLHAAQGFMDEEVHQSLLRIRKIQDSMVC